MAALTVKKGGIYTTPTKVFVKKNGVYVQVVGVFVKVNGAYQSTLGPAATFNYVFTERRTAGGDAIFA